MVFAFWPLKRVSNGKSSRPSAPATLSKRTILGLSLLVGLSSFETSLGCRSKNASDFGGRTVEGEFIALSDFRGQVVLVNFWATWCPPCVAELPEMSRIHRSFHDQGFSVLGVNVDASTREQAVEIMMKRKRVQFPNLLDPSARIASQYGVSGYPTSILIGRDGKQIWRRGGMIRPNDPELKQEIENALSQAQAKSSANPTEDSTAKPDHKKSDQK